MLQYKRLSINKVIKFIKNYLKQLDFNFRNRNRSVLIVICFLHKIRSIIPDLHFNGPFTAFRSAIIMAKFIFSGES